LSWTRANSRSSSNFSPRLEEPKEGSKVQRFGAERPTQKYILAVFEASALAFELPQAATLEDLANRLARLSDRLAERWSASM